MILIGKHSGIAFWRYDPSMDEPTWSFRYGTGGQLPKRPPGELSQKYRYEISAEWRSLATCFEWWQEVLGVERARRWSWRNGFVFDRPSHVCQLRIHSFRRWPVAIHFHSAVKNVYDRHALTEGDWFWRCDHGVTGFGEGFEWLGCWRCAMWKPIKAFRHWREVRRNQTEESTCEA